VLDDAFATAERRELRALVRAFVEKEVLPHHEEWERLGEVPRSLHREAGELGLLGVGVAEEHGGSGGDLIDKAVMWEAFVEAGGSTGLLVALFGHEIAVPHIIASGDRDLIERWVAPTLAGEMIGALGVTEPGAGSDVAKLSTAAVAVDGGYRVRGSKTFITSGHRADFVTTAVRTGGAGHQGVSLVVVDTASAGFVRGRRLEKTGWRCSDTAELYFDDLHVPASQLVGAEGTGFGQLMANFQTERLWLAVAAYSSARRCLALAEQSVRERSAFGAPLIDRQVVQHLLVDMAQRVELAQTYTREIICRYVRGGRGASLDGQVSMAKNASTSACSVIADHAVRLHGGMGFMRESEVERHYRDAPVLSIGGGAKEVMSDVAAKRLGFRSS
jgi:acyl-CoA dehydrogenase